MMILQWLWFSRLFGDLIVVSVILDQKLVRRTAPNIWIFSLTKQKLHRKACLQLWASLPAVLLTTHILFLKIMVAFHHYKVCEVLTLTDSRLWWTSDHYRTLWRSHSRLIGGHLMRLFIPCRSFAQHDLWMRDTSPVMASVRPLVDSLCKIFCFCTWDEPMTSRGIAQHTPLCSRGAGVRLILSSECLEYLNPMCSCFCDVHPMRALY